MKNKSSKIFVRKLFTIITIALFSVALIVPGILFFVMDKPKTSEVENRELKKVPDFSVKTLSNGSYTEELGNYYADNFIFREKLVKKSFDFEDMRGLRLDGVKIIDSDKENSDSSDKKICIDDELQGLLSSSPYNPTVKLGEKPLTITSDQLVLKNKEEYADITNNGLEGQKKNGLFVIGDTALEIFGGTESSAYDYVQVINAFRASFASDIKVYSEVVPTHFEFGLPTKYREEIGKRQKPIIDYIYKNLDSKIITVDAYSQIKDHYNDGEYLYFRSDHHWTGKGAYYAYTAFADKAGFEPIELSKYETGKFEPFSGTLNTTNDREVSKNPDFVEYYIPFTEYEMKSYDENGNALSYGTAVIATKIGNPEVNAYLTFLGGDKPLSVIKTNNNTGRSILVFKESYGNAFVPFLLPHYDNIYVADIRTFPFNTFNFVDDKGIKEVLFLNNCLTACSTDRIYNYMQLLDKK